jgi:hypothetical protein
VQNGKPPCRYGGQVNKNKNKDGDRHNDMAVSLSLQYTSDFNTSVKDNVQMVQYKERWFNFGDTSFYLFSSGQL